MTMNRESVPPFLRRSPFLRRLEAAATIGRIVRSGGRYISIPLEHRCPAEPFEPRMTPEDRRYLADWERRVIGPRKSRRRHLPRPPSQPERVHAVPGWWSDYVARSRGQGGVR